MTAELARAWTRLTGEPGPPPVAPGNRPVPLPFQALDHASGWLLARTAAWLDGLGRVAPGVEDTEAGDTLEEVGSPFGMVTRVRCPGTIGGCPVEWAGPPSPLGSHDPQGEAG